MLLESPGARPLELLPDPLAFDSGPSRTRVHSPVRPGFGKGNAAGRKRIGLAGRPGPQTREDGRGAGRAQSRQARVLWVERCGDPVLAAGGEEKPSFGNTRGRAGGSAWASAHAGAAPAAAPGTPRLKWEVCPGAVGPFLRQSSGRWAAAGSSRQGAGCEAPALTRGESQALRRCSGRSRGNCLIRRH